MHPEHDHPVPVAPGPGVPDPAPPVLGAAVPGAAVPGAAVPDSAPTVGDDADPTVAEDRSAAGPRLAAVESALAGLVDAVEGGGERAAARERVIDRQHREIERLRAVERVGSMRPVVTDLCRLRNDLLRQAATLPADATVERFTELLRSYADTVEESLDRCGVAVLPAAVGAAFEPGRQQVVGVVEVAEPELDGTIAVVVQDGYAEVDGGKVVAPTRITLHRAVAAAAAGTENGTKENADG